MAVASAGPHANQSRKITMPTPYRPDALPGAQLCQSTEGCHLQCLIMAALHSRCRHYIFILWFLLASSFFFPHLISAIADWMSTTLPHMVCLSANLECRSGMYMYCAQLAENTDAKNQKFTIWAPSHKFIRLYLRN